MTREAEPVRIEITEDSSAGMRVRLHNNGRFPDVLSGIPRHIVRRARPWLWNSYERRVMKAAKTMSWQSRRLVRNILIAERARVLQERDLQPKRAGWIARRRRADVQRAATRERLDGLLPSNTTTVTVHAPPVPPRQDDRSAARIDAGVTRPAQGMAGDDRTRTAPATQGGADTPKRSLIEDVLADSRTVAQAPQEPLRHDHGARLDVAALFRPAVGRELSLIERMAAGTALDSVKAMPSHDRPDDQARNTRDDSFDRSR